MKIPRMINCEICGTKFKIIDNAYVCEEGHTLENKVEVADDIHATPILIAPKEEGTASILSKYSGDYITLLLFHLLFEDIKGHLKIKSSKYFEIFVNFFSEGRNQTLHGPSICFSMLRTLTYYSKRIEMEAENKTYLYLDYCKSMESYVFEEKLQEKLDMLHLKKSECRTFHPLSTDYGLIPIYMILKCLGDVGTELEKDSYRRLRHSETGVLDEELENNKACFRQDLRRDYKIFFEYLKRICDIFMLEITDDLEKKFRIFFYASDFSHIIHIPEMEIAPFLYIYIMNHRRDFDIERAIKNFREVCLESFYKTLEDDAYSSHKEIGSAMTKKYDTQNTFQASVKFLLFSISWSKESDFGIRVSAIKRLLRSCVSLKNFRSYWKREHGLPVRNFNRSVWYIRKLKLQKRGGHL